MEKMSNVDTKVLTGIAAVCVLVLIGGIALYVLIHRRDGKKEKDFDYDPPYRPPVPQNEYPLPPLLADDVTPEEWERYIASAKRSNPGAQKSEIKQIAFTMANDAITERKQRGMSGHAVMHGGADMSELRGGYDTTVGTPEPEALHTDDGTAYDADRTEPVTPDEPADAFDVAGAFARMNTQINGGAAEPADPGFSAGAESGIVQTSQEQEFAAQPEQPAYQAPSEPAPVYEAPAEPAPVYTPPAAQQPAEEEFTDWAECARLAEKYEHFDPNRQYDGGYTLAKKSGTGPFIGIERPDGKLRVLLNPGAFPSDYPFYLFGIQIIDLFFEGGKGEGQAVHRVKAAVCVPVPGKPGEYQCEKKGMIEQDD